MAWGDPSYDERKFSYFRVGQPVFLENFTWLRKVSVVD